jgi:hypothetical protein
MCLCMLNSVLSSDGLSVASLVHDQHRDRALYWMEQCRKNLRSCDSCTGDRVAFYSPVIQIMKGQVVVRWLGPEIGMILPQSIFLQRYSFIPG